jgi:hypothetical protein
MPIQLFNSGLSRSDLGILAKNQSVTRTILRFSSFLNRRAAVLKMNVETRRLRLRCRGARRRRVQQGVFSYKKGERGNPLLFLNRKRQILTVLRHIRTVNRQKPLALLSVMCQCADC